MEWIKSLLELIQHNKILYIIAVPVVLGLCSTAIFFIKNKVDPPDKHRKIRYFIITLILCVITEFIPLFISVYYPYIDGDNHDGYLKLSFYDGSFAYHNYIGQEVIYESDVFLFDRSYFDNAIAPTVYITIMDDTNRIVYDSKSEHMDSCLIDLKYGTYTLIASCDNYQKYNVTLTLTPDNKTSDVWQHRIYFLPDIYIATDIKVQVQNKDGIPYNNIDISIGIPGYSLTETVDEHGVFDELFVLAKGEYLVYISDEGLHGRFVVNELTNDESLIVVTLTD